MSGLHCDIDGRVLTLVAFTGFNTWSYTGPGSFSDAFTRDRRFRRFARGYNQSAKYLRRTPVADMDYLAALVDYALFLQNSELRWTFSEYGDAPSADTWNWQDLTALPGVPSAEMRQSRPYLDGLRNFGLASEMYSKPACLAAVRNAQSSLSAGISKYEVLAHLSRSEHPLIDVQQVSEARSVAASTTYPSV